MFKDGKQEKDGEKLRNDKQKVRATAPEPFMLYLPFTPLLAQLFGHLSPLIIRPTFNASEPLDDHCNPLDDHRKTISSLAFNQSRPSSAADPLLDRCKTIGPLAPNQTPPRGAAGPLDDHAETICSLAPNRSPNPLAISIPTQPSAKASDHPPPAQIIPSSACRTIQVATRRALSKTVPSARPSHLLPQNSIPSPAIPKKLRAHRRAHTTDHQVLARQIKPAYLFLLFSLARTPT